MSSYLDAGFLITLLVETNGTRIAKQTVTEVESPCKITRLHEFQLLTLLAKIRFTKVSENERAVQEAEMLWRWYIDEGVLEIIDLDWNSALASATRFVEQQTEAPPAPFLILHPVLAAHSGASHFLSFDPRSRAIARLLGLKVLPEKI
jgi:hypothetical protein